MHGSGKAILEEAWQRLSDASSNLAFLKTKALGLGIINIVLLSHSIEILQQHNTNNHVSIIVMPKGFSHSGQWCFVYALEIGSRCCPRDLAVRA